jgi:putative transcriptional regulator
VMNMELICRLEDLINERGLKKGYIAEKAGISKTTLTSLMKNRTLPTLPVAIRIAEIMELRIEEIWIKKN